MKNEIKKRGIKFLVHFTRYENLKEIFKHGLIPRAKFKEKKIESLINDTKRLNGLINASSLSITFPNYKMFYRLRIENDNNEWVVIVFNIAVILEKECAFCQDNAANINISRIPLKERKGIDAFKKMFENIEGKPSRKKLGLCNNMTTNPQAEVLVFDVIETGFIIGMAFSNVKTRDKAIKEFPEFKDKMYYKEYYFNSRHDYENWR